MTAKSEFYDPAAIEAKWQKKWEEDRLYDTARNADDPTCYVLDMFPYPSGNSMHVGHPRGYVGTDVYSRFKRMNGFQVLHPMGWDSFGLPAEETAIALQQYPSISVERNISVFRKQLKKLGLSYDWTRQVNTSDPKFYKHTQRLFLEFFRKGLAYNKKSLVNWCPALGTVLANEDIENGVSERGGHPIELLPLRQWMLKITAYADRLVDDLQGLKAWPDKVKNAQTSWIGRSNGHNLAFSIVGKDVIESVDVEVFTTRIETLFGVTFVALAPGSDLAQTIQSSASNADEVANYVDANLSRPIKDRQVTAEPTGIILQGIFAIHPISGDKVPVILADYVLENHGSGAVMGVPAHDDRDQKIAALLNLESRRVIDEDGLIINSAQFDGQPYEEARFDIASAASASQAINYKMRDWVFSRQRFWGEPFPIIWIEGLENYNLCKKGPVSEWLPEIPVHYEEEGREFFAVPVMPNYLDQVRLPVVENYKPTGDMEGPLAGIEQWSNVWLDPQSGSLSQTLDNQHFIKAQRDTNTMPQWAGSSWYWLRFMDNDNADEPFSFEAVSKWGPVDIYAGADHAVAHLIYARFWQKVLYDAGLVNHDEPFKRLEFLGYILSSDGTKISKRSNNSRNPDDIISEMGADALRMYEMMIGPFDKPVAWNDAHLAGHSRFLGKVYSRGMKIADQGDVPSHPDVTFRLNSCIKQVSNDIERFHFNTAVSALMSFMKEFHMLDIGKGDFRVFLQLLAPFAPHLSEEIWQKLGSEQSIHESIWPQLDDAALKRAVIQVPIQINGKKRAVVDMPSGADEAEARKIVLQDTQVMNWVGNTPIIRFVFVTDKIVNIVL